MCATHEKTINVEVEKESEEASKQPTTNEDKIIAHATSIREAFVEVSPDALVDIIITTNVSERLQIAKAYARKYGKPLEHDLVTKLGNKDLGKLMTGMFEPRSAFLAKDLRHAISGIGTDENTLSEILCCLTASELKELIGTYHMLHKKVLLKDIEEDTSGDFRKLLLKLVQVVRNENEDDRTEFNVRVADVVKKLNPEVPTSVSTTTTKPLLDNIKYVFHSKKQKAENLNVDIQSLIDVFSTHSFIVIDKASQNYERITGYELTETVRKSAKKADFRELLLDILQFSVNRTEFYVHKIHDGLTQYKLKPSRKSLTRALVMLSHSELAHLQFAYQTFFRRKIINVLDGKPEDPYKSAVNRILNSCDN
ncbi:unnamed protein product [Orchesella dallaii]|uniref:Annexin n=1 Tax=Orchesella dallaii TaxID=48710 RepID=A0ABP1RHG2_9HEXA